MLFLNPWLLLALAGVSIPVILHLVRRQAAKPMDWGAMRFLHDTLSERRRKMEWEDLLLMAARCLLLALAALAITRPFVPPDSTVPWMFVLPAALLAIAAFGASFVLASRKMRLLLRLGAAALAFVAAGLVFLEHTLNLKRFEGSGRRDVAIIIDASSSMTRETLAGNVFEEAREEAKRIVGDAPRGTSFVIVSGGPSPRALTSTPLTHRADVLEQLAALKPVGGTFRAHEALGVATLALAEGNNSAKQIIVLTDGQRHGWRFGDAGAWQTLEEAWDSLPQKPKLLLRRIGTKETLRNAGISGVVCNRRLVGTDRPSVVRVSVENTGTEPVTPGAVTLEVEGQLVGSESLGMLVPGQSETVEFTHKFTTEGPQALVARLDARDEVPDDDRAEHIVTVRKKVRVLLVDGNPSGAFFDRAAGHTALALAPTGALLMGRDPGDGFLMDPRVVAAPDLSESDFEEADVIVLADVPRLPSMLASKLTDRLAGGIGLVVIAGPRSDRNFYNQWTVSDGPLMPLELGEETGNPEGVSPAPATFQHESLALFRDEAASDLGQAVIQRWCKAETRPGSGVVGAGFSNGDPFLAGRIYGRGRCLMLSCALDRRSGNLPARTSFVPLVHELVSWAAGGGPGLNIDAAWSPSIALGGSFDGGLVANYYRGGNEKRAVIERIDPGVDFQWGAGSPAGKMPADNFTVVWRGGLVAPFDGEYLIEAEVDDEVTMTVGGSKVLSTTLNEPKSGKVSLKAGRSVPVEIRYREETGDAYVRLFWTPEGGVKSLIPPSAWLPVAETSSESFAVLDPLGETRRASVSSGRRGRELRIEGEAVPGLYRVELPESLRDAIPTLGKVQKLPVVVRRDIDESRIELSTEEDLEEIRSRIDTFVPESPDDVLAVMSGRGFGREITRMIAIAALIFLVLETALGRWVSKSRRAGEVENIDFGTDEPIAFGKGGAR